MFPGTFRNAETRPFVRFPMGAVAREEEADEDGAAEESVMSPV